MYVSNNPLVYTDPTGLVEVIEDKKDSEGYFVPARPPLTVAPINGGEDGYQVVQGGEDYPNSLSRNIKNYELTGDEKWLKKAVGQAGNSGNDFIKMELIAASDPEALEKLKAFSKGAAWMMLGMATTVAQVGGNLTSRESSSTVTVNNNRLKPGGMSSSLKQDITQQGGYSTTQDQNAGGAAIPSVRTPYGNAAQSNSNAALNARTQVQSGASLYRIGTTGHSAAGEGQFWALEHPNTPGYANRYGVPAENITNANFIESATLQPGTQFITRPAPGIGGNFGGGIEVVVPQGGVKIDFFSILH